ncbi:hypothetical protein TCAL_00077 [Tigriopus californicus]|uniref:ARF7 effector protein C-terminal domain-containing protein n=1 Tax=Tigriopus californicus TaxID=6832 RepID=A0A553PFN3_TIGCA|nr:uncharacterized protein LOC131880106 isoform X1 [Tigriopus californicus]TRY76495.1 hypothetical protein TCAL_00077 [Tigriopus californicus]|eukprot:TCALIF_00077-PA protein Name:"Similar to Arl14ep ARL14 effector protein (Rattus norvegicus)" AED:0.00 eAED:0.00 QI:360/1/1/1/0/0/2/295/222
MATPGRPPSSGMARKSTSKASIPTARKSTSSASSVSSVTPQVASHRFAMESDSHDPSALTDPTFQVPRQHRYAERTSGRVSSKNPIFDNSLERRRSRTLRPRESMSINYARNGGVKQMGDRERRKAANAAKQTLIAKKQAKTLYNEVGILTTCQKDLCDCMTTLCPGCHFPCPKCGSNKCALECRNNRKWQYETLELEGTTNSLIQNPFLISGPAKHLALRG